MSSINSGWDPETIVWACWGQPGSVRSLTLFAASLRRFGGRMARCPVRVYVPEPELAAWQPEAVGLQSLGVDIRSFPAVPSVAAFPYAGKPLAAAAAEQESTGAELLVWFDVWSLVTGEPAPLVLAEGEDLAYRPVEVVNIGRPAGAPPDSFWSEIYNAFGLTADAAFPMITTSDRHNVAAYINASMLAVRPSLGLMIAWREAFLRLLRQERWQPLFDQVPERATYFHQAVLTGLLLTHLSRSRMREFSHLASYPLHLQGRLPADVRVGSLSDLLLCRHYGFFETPGWSALIGAGEELRSFLTEHDIQA